MFSCDPYDDYVVDTVGYTTVYFPKTELKRSAIAGEGLEVKVGVNIGGIRENDKDHEVTFIIDPTLLVGTSYKLLPSDYYTLGSNDKISVPKGSFQGLLSVKLDSLKILNDPLIADFNYAIPFKIVSSSLDSILSGRGQTIIPIKLMNTYEGNYYQEGNLKRFFTATKVLDTAYVYGDRLDGPSTPIRALKTSSTNAAIVDGIAVNTGSGFSLKLKINPDNTVDVIAEPTSQIQVQSNGVNKWDPVKRIFTLNYKYSKDNRNFEVEETLIFRNRIRDGFNEWRWEGFPGN